MALYSTYAASSPAGVPSVERSRRPAYSSPPTLLSLATVVAYSCFTPSQPSNQDGGRLPGAQRFQRGVVTCDECREGMLRVTGQISAETGHQRHTWHVKLVLTQGEQNCSGTTDCRGHGRRWDHMHARSRCPQSRKTQHCNQSHDTHTNCVKKRSEGNRVWLRRRFTLTCASQDW